MTKKQLNKVVLTTVEFIGKTQREVDDEINSWVRGREVGEVIEGIGRRVEIGFHGSIEHQICYSYEGRMEHHSMVVFRETFEEE